MSYKFWMVWNERGNSPKRKHESAEMAAAEADRLAKQNPGQRFFVLESLGSCGMDKIIWEGTVPDYIPF